MHGNSEPFPLCHSAPFYFVILRLSILSFCAFLFCHSVRKRRISAYKNAQNKRSFALLRMTDAALRMTDAAPFYFVTLRFFFVILRLSILSLCASFLSFCALYFVTLR